MAIQGAYALAVAPGGTAYVLAVPSPDSQQGFVVPVHVRAGTTGNPIKVGLSPLQIAFTPDGTMAYVANYASASVTPIRLADGRAEPPIAAGKIPTRLAASPDGATVYVLDSNHIRRAGPGNAAREVVLRDWSGHSDPRRDELCREAHKGRPVPDCHGDRRLNLR